MGYELTLSGTGAALVLGGSGGAGGEISIALARAGSDIALTYNTNEARSTNVAKEVGSLGAKASSWRLDMSVPDSIAEIVSAVAAEHGGIHTLVYAIGPIFSWAPLGEVSTSELLAVLTVETVGFHAVVHAALPHLRMARGSIVACTTWANRRMMPSDGLSTAPKAAIDSMVRQLACEEAAHDVRANIVSLGSIDIGMGSASNERSMVKGISEQQWATMLKTIPLGNRLGRGAELASAVVYLASDQASYVTGQTIIVDGGLSL